MKKPAGVIAIIALAASLTWGAEQVGGWLGFSQQPPPGNEEQPAGNEDVAPSHATPGNTAGVVPPPGSASPATEADGKADASPLPELSARATSIEEDLARIEEALESGEVLEEFTPSEPLSADNPVVWPTDI